MATAQDILAEFVASLTVNDNKTVKAYQSAVKGFINWFVKQPGGSPFAIEKITAVSIRIYLEHLATKGRAPRTRSQALAALRRFCRWAIGQGYMTHNPANQVKRPTVVNMAPRELTTEQRYALRNHIELQQSLRLSAIFALGYWAGMRISEIASLQMTHCHINKRAGNLTIIEGKNGKTRTIDLHAQARQALYNYLTYKDFASQDSRDPDSQYVFTSQRAAWLRQQERPDHLTIRGVEHIWTKVKRIAPQTIYDMLKDIRFHDLRHDFAHRARQSGWNLEEIAIYLGHQTSSGTPAIATTARYTLPSRQQLKTKLKQLSG